MLLCLCHIISLLVVTSTAPSVDFSRRWNVAAKLRRSAEPKPEPDEPEGHQKGVDDESCRCAADQWEGVLRSIDREFYVTRQTDSSEQLAAGQRLGVAEMVSNTGLRLGL